MPRKSRSKEEIEQLFEEYELKNLGNYFRIREDKTEFDGLLYGKEKTDKDFLLNISEYDDRLKEKIEGLGLSIPECQRLIELIKENYID